MWHSDTHHSLALHYETNVAAVVVALMVDTPEKNVLHNDYSCVRCSEKAFFSRYRVLEDSKPKTVCSKVFRVSRSSKEKKETWPKSWEEKK